MNANSDVARLKILELEAEAAKLRAALAESHAKIRALTADKVILTGIILRGRDVEQAGVEPAFRDSLSV